MPPVMLNAMPRTIFLRTLCAAALPPVGWSADTTRPEKASRLSAQQQQSALEFVKEHHPQLNTLINRLKNRDPAEYHKALTDVFRTYERLERMQERDRPRYEVELKLWKVNSRIRLLAARMAADQAADQSPTLESQLRHLLSERTDLRLQQLALERERLNSRIERIDSQAAQLSSEREAVIDREVERLQRSVRSRSSRVSKPSADGPPAEAGTGNRGERKDRAEQKQGTSSADGPAEPPASKPPN
jgi:hypothetical protein